MKNLRLIPKRLSKVSLVMLMQISVMLVVSTYQAIAVENPVPSELPVKDMVTMIDLGAKKCIPCKLMAPILEELKEEYKGRASIIFIDVWDDKSHGKRFGVHSIPTQIFYDKHGKEVFRHTGFFSKEKIKDRLDKLIETK